MSSRCTFGHWIHTSSRKFSLCQVGSSSLARRMVIEIWEWAVMVRRIQDEGRGLPSFSNPHPNSVSLPLRRAPSRWAPPGQTLSPSSASFFPPPGCSSWPSCCCSCPAAARPRAPTARSSALTLRSSRPRERWPTSCPASRGAASRASPTARYPRTWPSSLGACRPPMKRPPTAGLGKRPRIPALGVQKGHLDRSCKRSLLWNPVKKQLSTCNRARRKRGRPHPDPRSWHSLDRGGGRLTNVNLANLFSSSLGKSVSGSSEDDWASLKCVMPLKKRNSSTCMGKNSNYQWA
jgi:hypothetical protein